MGLGMNRGAMIQCPLPSPQWLYPWVSLRVVVHTHTLVDRECGRGLESEGAGLAGDNSAVLFQSKTSLPGARGARDTSALKRQEKKSSEF